MRANTPAATQLEDGRTEAARFLTHISAVPARVLSTPARRGTVGLLVFTSAAVSYRDLGRFAQLKLRSSFASVEVDDDMYTSDEEEAAGPLHHSYSQ